MPESDMSEANIRCGMQVAERDKRLSGLFRNDEGKLCKGWSAPAAGKQVALVQLINASWRFARL